MNRYKIIYFPSKPNGERARGTRAMLVELPNIEEAIQFCDWLNIEGRHDIMSIWKVSPEPQEEKWMISWIPAARRNVHTDTWHISRTHTHTNTTAGA